ncbi:hypothetical protein IWX75_001522 [Arthrobacter sp. CAN_A6]|uniref:hypothetical protein n=1 Tax=Arthrobacter sp. CAN_A6 TaxID=2787721 RepID=UPI0018C9A487
MGSAGASLGELIAAVANLTMVECVVLSGEGMGLGEAAAKDIDRAIAYYRDPEAAPIRLHRQPTDFTQWARGAAAVAIQRTISGTLDGASSPEKWPGRRIKNDAGDVKLALSSSVLGWR